MSNTGQRVYCYRQSQLPFTKGIYASAFIQGPIQADDSIFGPDRFGVQFNVAGKGQAYALQNVLQVTGSGLNWILAAFLTSGGQTQNPDGTSNPAFENNTVLSTSLIKESSLADHLLLFSFVDDVASLTVQPPGTDAGKQTWSYTLPYSMDIYSATLNTGGYFGGSSATFGALDVVAKFYGNSDEVDDMQGAIVPVSLPPATIPTFVTAENSPNAMSTLSSVGQNHVVFQVGIGNPLPH